MALSSGTLKSLMQPLIFARLQEKFPLIAPHPEQIKQQNDLAEAIAAGVSEALIPFLISNTVVTVISNGATGPTAIGSPAAIVALPGTGTIS